ncbi:hypothetical protein [Rhodoluna limnophila]|jgi:hypothetical protein|nr:hypothetical protein [Rhodoluna limnophila]
MSEDLVSQVSEQVSQITDLPLEEQPVGFSALRDLLENELNSASKTSVN